MLTLSDLSWTGTRWEIRTADGFVGLDDLLNKIDVLEIKGAMYHIQQAAEYAMQDDLIALRRKLAEKEVELQAMRNAANQYKRDCASVTAERDAAMEYIPRDCGTCKHWRPRTDSPCAAPVGIPCEHRKRQAWQWRGLEMEDGKSE